MNGKIIALGALVLTAGLVQAAEVRFDGHGSLQAALDAGGRVTVAKGVWKVDPGFVHSDTEIVFEDGAELVANPKGFFGVDDCVLTVSRQTNVVIRGGTIRMHRADYLAKRDGRPRSQHRHGVSLRGAVNVRVEDMRFFECGGDGVYVANADREPCRNITVRNVFCDRPLRQSMSVIDVDGLLIENCTFQRALGENPQAGIDFEPNHPWQRLKGVVMRNCRLLGNARNAIDIYVAQMDGTSEPVDMRFENCTTISNRTGFGLSMNRRLGFPSGRIIVTNCLFKANREQGVNIGQKPSGCLALELVDTRIVDSCRELPERGDIHLLSRYDWDNPVDDILFRNVTVVQSRKGPWIRYENRGRGAKAIENVRGDVTVTDAEGRTVRHSLTPADCERLFPRPPGAPVTPQCVDWQKECPSPYAGRTELQTVYARGRQHFAFYVDRARRVAFEGGLRGDVWTSWRPTEKPGAVELRKLGCRNWRRGKLSETALPVKRGDFSFEVPSEGWYLMSLASGKSGFLLYASEVPVWMSLGGKEAFDPSVAVLALSPKDTSAAVLRRSSGADSEKGWALTPTGPAASLNLPTQFVKGVALKSERPRYETFRFADRDRIGVLVVPPDDAEARQFAEEIRWHFREMSGIEVPVVTNRTSAGPAIVLRRGEKNGETRFTTSNGILAVAGKGKGLSHGVTYLLEAMGVRYLWPGRLGKVIPKCATLDVPVLDFAFQPKFRSRRIRSVSQEGAERELIAKLGFTREELRAYAQRREAAEIDHAGNRDYFAWHGVAREDDCEEKREWGHAFGNYYARFGETHPEYFALQPDGTRKLNLKKHPNRPTFCLSNEGLVRQVSDEVIADFRKRPELALRSVCLPDGGDSVPCLCPNCRALDPPDGAPVEFWIRNAAGVGHFEPYVSLTDRTIRFFNRVAERVTAACPGKRLSCYAYSYYIEPPRAVKPHPALAFLSVAGNYETRAGRESVERCLAAFCSFGNEVMWRPNTLIGIRMAVPQAIGRGQFDDLEKAKANGVTGVDVCAASEQWACRAFDVYLAAKGILNPDRLDAETHLGEFCRAGFGAAAPALRRYFAALESMAVRAAAEPVEANTTTTGPSCMKGYVKAFDPDRLEAILDDALRAADSEDVRRRVEFLKLGLVAGRADRAIGLKRLEGKNCRAEQKAFVACLRRLMALDPLAVAPYWCASTFYEPHMRGYRPE